MYVNVEAEMKDMMIGERFSDLAGNLAQDQMIYKVTNF